MTFWEHFIRLLPLRPRQALVGLYWQLTRRKIRARNCLFAASVDLPFAYEIWIDKVEKIPEAIRQAPIAAKSWTRLPEFSILLYTSEDFSDAEFRRSINSVKRQAYPRWRRIDGPPHALAERIEQADGDFLVPLRIGDELSELALFRFAEALQDNGTAAILYGDQDEIDVHGRRMRPWFKPRWNEELFLAHDYLSSAVAIEAVLARRLASPALNGVPELVLLASAAANGAVVHVPHITCHVGDGTSLRPLDGRQDAIAQYLQTQGAKCASGPFQTIKVEWPLPANLPLVTIIVPTKDKLELLRPCIESLLERTDYDNFEILIVDNGSIERQTATYLAQISRNSRVRVLDYPGPYNFSAINNYAAAQAHGTFLCLLNNDTEVIEAAWLTELMRYAVRPDIAAAGPMLLYQDGTIQHAGVVIGIGDAAGHAHRFLPANSPGYFKMPHVAQFVSAVTAACLVVEKAKYEAVGGLDEKHLAVAFNDVDLCLKLQSAGWRNVYVPHAVLVHHESKSRGSDLQPQQVDRYRRELATLQDRWGTKTYQDPLHNPNLDRYNETYVFRL